MKLNTAIFAGGCFWGMEDLFRRVDGVHDTEVGYCGGEKDTASYYFVKKGDTGHAESLLVKYDESKVSYLNLLKVFFSIHDPTTLNQQGNDIGSQYRSAIFYLNESQKTLAESVIRNLNQSETFAQPIVTEVSAAKEFYPAEEEHQDYLQRIPNGYTCHYPRQIEFPDDLDK